MGFFGQFTKRVVGYIKGKEKRIKVKDKNRVAYDEEDMAYIEDSVIAELDGKDKTDFDNAKKGNYDNYYRMSPILKGYLAAKKLRGDGGRDAGLLTNLQNRQNRVQTITGGDPNIDPKITAASVVKSSRTDPVLRTALSLADNSGNKTERAREIGDELDRLAYVDMLTPFDPGSERDKSVRRAYTDGQIEREREREKQILKDTPSFSGEGFNKVVGLFTKHRTAKEWWDTKSEPNDANEAVIRNTEQQKMMMKAFLFMQASDFRINQNDNDPARQEPYNGNMASALSHCGRVMFILPETNHADPARRDAAFNALLGNDAQRAGAGVEHRAAATHAVEPPLKNGEKVYKEDSDKLSFFYDSGTTSADFRTDRVNHLGCDIAVGGLGEQNASGKTILNDGRSGHLYIGYRPESGTNSGAVLFGMESDSPYRANQYGHIHTAAADKEDISSTGGSRFDAIGAHHGGRVVNISISAEKMKVLSDAVDAIYATNDNARIAALGYGVTGPRMDAHDLSMLLTANGVNMEGEPLDLDEVRERTERVNEAKPFEEIINEGRTPMKAAFPTKEIVGVQERPKFVPAHVSEPLVESNDVVFVPALAHAHVATPVPVPALDVFHNPDPGRFTSASERINFEELSRGDRPKKPVQLTAAIAAAVNMTMSGMGGR